MTLDQFVAITKALSDPSRVRAYRALLSGELCVCQIIELLGLAASTVSKHMSILKQAKLVESRKEGRWIYFKLPTHDSLRIQSWLESSLESDISLVADTSSLKKIKCADLDALCKKHRDKTS